MAHAVPQNRRRCHLPHPILTPLGFFRLIWIPHRSHGFVFLSMYPEYATGDPFSDRLANALVHFSAVVRLWWWFSACAGGEVGVVLARVDTKYPSGYEVSERGGSPNGARGADGSGGRRICLK